MIIITTQCFHPKIGGIEALMTGMAEEMAKSGKDILVLADGPINKTDNLQNYKIKRFNAWKPIRRTGKARYIKNICKKEKIEAIYADSWKSIQYLKLVDAPVYVLAHGTEIQKNFNDWNLYKKNKQIRIYNSYMNANKIVANSSYTKELLLESLSIDKNKIKIIHPGIDIYNEFIGAIPLPLDPNTLDKCICQYTLQTGRLDDFVTRFVDKDHFYGTSQKKNILI